SRSPLTLCGLRCALEGEHHFVEAGMRLTEGLVALEQSFRFELLDDAFRGVEILALRVIHDASAIEAAMQTRGDPAWHFARDLRRLCEVIDQRLLAARRDGEDVDLCDDGCVGSNDRHMSALL